MKISPRIAAFRQTLASVSTALALSTLPLSAEDVFVCSFQNATATSGVTPCQDLGGGFSGPVCIGGTVSRSGTSTYSTAVPQPPISPRRSLYGYGTDAVWNVTPGDYLSVYGDSYGTAPLQTPGIYKIYITMPTLVNASPDVLVAMTAVGGDLANAGGIASAAVSLTAFRSTSTANTWIHVGYITNSVPNPTVTFTFVSGTAASTGGRWYMDTVRFERLDPCTGVANQLGVTGPLVAGQSVVNVTAVAEGATNVTVYADAVEIGQTNYAAGFPAGQVVVPVSSPLVKGTKITAKQIKNGCPGTPPGFGPVVGGGPNPPVAVLLSCWKNSDLTGPAGVNGGPPVSGFPYVLKASTTVGNVYNTAPQPGELLMPNTCWQTVTFLTGADGDDAIDMNSNTHVTNTDAYCSLEGLVFSIDSSLGVSDSGPYDIYVDTIVNGDTVIEDFEGYEAGTVATFNAPNTAPQPTAGSTFLASPNSSEISQNNAFEGAKSCRIRWQFADDNSIRWTHVRANAATGKFYPQLDTTKPITVRYLVVPVGETSGKLSLTSVPKSQTGYLGQPLTLSVAANGTPPYTYQWKKDGNDLQGATTSSYSFNSLTSGDAGVYSVTVNDTYCNMQTPPAVLTVSEQPPPPGKIDIAWVSPNVVLSWTGTYVLQSSLNVTGTFSDVIPTPTSPYSTTSTGTLFYRLRTP